MEKTGKEIILYMAQDQGWHTPSVILKGTGLGGRNPEKPMSLPNIIKRCNFLVNDGVLKIPDPVKDRDVYRMKEKGVFCIRDDIDTFKRLVTEFVGTPDTEKFFYSTYCQNMINSELVEKIKTEWDYPKNIDIEKGFKVLPMYNSMGEKTHDIKVDFDENSKLTDEKVIELLLLSPSALRTLISTEYKMNGFLGQLVRPITLPVKADEKFESSRFDEILILNVILDLKKYHRKEGIKILLETEMKIKLQLINKDGTGKKDILGKTVDMVKIQPANKIKSKELTSEELLNKMIDLRENDTEHFTLFGGGYY